MEARKQYIDSKPGRSADDRHAAAAARAEAIAILAGAVFTLLLERHALAPRGLPAPPAPIAPIPPIARRRRDSQIKKPQ